MGDGNDGQWPKETVVHAFSDRFLHVSRLQVFTCMCNAIGRWYGLWTTPAGATLTPRAQQTVRFSRFHQCMIQISIQLRRTLQLLMLFPWRNLKMLPLCRMLFHQFAPHHQVWALIHFRIHGYFWMYVRAAVDRSQRH